MELDRVAAVIRPRGTWEAVDLGFGMVRAWWRPVWAAWIAAVAPAWWLVFGLTWWLTGEPFAALLAAWWLRPFFDRVPLYVVSRHLFGTTPSIRNVLRDLPRLWTRHFWAGLLVQRLDPARSFDLPVWELEGLRGSERSARATLLRRDSRQKAIWLTFACSTLEGLTMTAVFELVSLLSPSSGWSRTLGASGEAANAGDLTTAAWWWVAAVVFLAFSAIEPFYVAAGFSLYLSRRIHLEGWDVEIAFRRLAARLAGGEPLRRGAGKVAAGVLLLALVLHPAAARGQEAGKGGLTPSQAVREVLQEPELQTRKKMKVWRPKGDWDVPRSKAKEAPAPPSGISLGFLQPLVLAVAAVLLLGLLAVAIGGMVKRPRRLALDDETERRTPLPTAVFGLDIRPESLPDDVPAAAWSAWERGEPALAMGLLYRSAIACLVHREGLAVRESWTEGDCVDFVEHKAGRERADTFRRLTRAWQSTAYAHRPPSTDEARALCSAWGRSFGAAP